MAFNKTIVREVYDLPIGTASCVKVVFETVQGKCSRCGHAKTFLPDEVDEKATATRRFMQYASALCRFMTASEAAAILPFSDDTIRRWDKAILEEQLGEVDLSNATKLLIDEKAIGQHHKYATLVLDGDNGELLFMSPGKKSESLIPFFEKMPENTRRNVIAACMDRNAGYPNVVRKFCPNAEIVRLFGRSTGAINFTS
jgi:transposase